MKSLLIHLLILVIAITLFGLKLELTASYLLFAVGMVLGFSLLFVDRLLHVFLVAPETEFSQIAQSAWKTGHYSSLFNLFLTAKDQQQKLLTRSAVFMLCFCALAIYVMTSTTSHLGAGMVIGLGLHYCIDLWTYRQNTELFHQHFLWQIQRSFSPTEITGIAVGFTAFWALLCAQMLF